MYRRGLVWTAIVCVSLVFASKGWADVPAPPVNQSLGFADVGIGDLAEADCRVCHSSGLPDRHHQLYGTPIPGGSIVPYPDGDGDGNDDTDYSCLNCHDQNFTVERDCTACHNAGSPHHTHPDATSGNCQACHGSIVDNAGDGHYIPTYSPSLVTPSRSGGTADQLNSRGTAAGGCDYCHDDDGLATPVILTNMALHHGTGLSSCASCHPGGSPTGGTAGDQMRQCEDCHGPDSLHNIQADSPAPGNVGTIVVGGEDAGYGHVGRDAGPTDSDCWGCHGFAGADLTSISGPLAPTVYDARPAVVKAGTNTLVTLTGSALTNTVGDVLFKSDVVLTATDGSSVTLTPGVVYEGLLKVAIPSSTAPGSYSLRAVKKDNEGDPVPSNPVALQVIPQVSITDVTTADGIVTIEGSGFAGYAEGSGTTVTGRTATATVDATIVSWSDTVIKADFDASPEAVTVKSVFGTVTYELGGKPD